MSTANLHSSQKYPLAPKRAKPFFIMPDPQNIYVPFQLAIYLLLLAILVDDLIQTFPF